MILVFLAFVFDLETYAKLIGFIYINYILSYKVLKQKSSSKTY